MPVAAILALVVAGCGPDEASSRVCTWNTEAPASDSGDTEEPHVCLSYGDPEIWTLEAHHLEPDSTLTGTIRDQPVELAIDGDGEGQTEIEGRADGEHWPLVLEGTTEDGDPFRAEIEEG